MDNDSYIGFLALHTHPIVRNLAELLNISEKEALDIFYRSNFYKIYEQENTKLWHFSTVTLSDLVYQEVTTGRIEFPVEG